MRSIKKRGSYSKIQYINNFDPIVNDCVFFEEHSTETENALKVYSRYLRYVRGENGFVRVMDFGTHTGLFMNSFLLRWGYHPSRLELTLIEPADNLRKQAVCRLQSFSDHRLQHYTNLPDELPNNFDLILANHSLYFVRNLKQTIDLLFGYTRANGRMLIAMSSRKNFLIQCALHGYKLIGTPPPFYTSEDLEGVLENKGLNYIRDEVKYDIIFPDLRENRIKILRFVFGEQLSMFPMDELLSFFNKFKKGRQIHIPTQHFLYAF